MAASEQVTAQPQPYCWDHFWLSPGRSGLDRNSVGMPYRGLPLGDLHDTHSKRWSYQLLVATTQTPICGKDPSCVVFWHAIHMRAICLTRS